MRALISVNSLWSVILIFLAVFSVTVAAQVPQVDVLAPEITKITFIESGDSGGKTTVTAVVDDDDKVESVMLSLYANQLRECRNVPDRKLTIEMLAEGAGSVYKVSYTDSQLKKLHEKSTVALPQDTCYSFEAKDRASNLSTRILNNPLVVTRSPVVAEEKPKSKLMYIVAGVVAVGLVAVLSQSGDDGGSDEGNTLLITAPAP